MITKAGADVGKLSSKYILVGNATLLSHYDRGYKPLRPSIHAFIQLA
jgi:hypothetical protein